MDPRSCRWLGQLFLLFVTAVIAVPSFGLLLIGPVLLVEHFPTHPLASSLILLLVGLVLVLCFLGSRLESRKVVSFLCRLVWMLFTIMVCLLSIELIPETIINIAAGYGAVLEDYLGLLGVLALMCVATAGLKIALELRARYWIVLLGVIGIALLTTLVAELAVFTS
jgi:hypothetical protein